MDRSCLQKTKRGKLLLPRLFLGLFLLALFLAKTSSQAFASCGINVDPANPTGYPANINGARWVRVEFKDCTASNAADSVFQTQTLPMFQGVIDHYHGQGAGIILIIDYSSYPNAASDIGGFAERAGIIRQAYGTSNIVYQIWNEPDISQGGNLSAEQYANMLGTVAQAIGGDAQIITAGLASGFADYLSNLRNAMGSNWNLIDGVAVHPYGKEVGGIGNTGPLDPFITQMYYAGGKPLWISEIGLSTTDQALQDQYLRAFYNYANTTGSSMITNVVWFCWSDGMVPYFGITGSNGLTTKQSYTGFFSAACGVSPPAAALLPAIVPQTEAGVGCAPPAGTGGEENFIPGDGINITSYGEGVFGRNVPCRPLISSQDPWIEPYYPDRDDASYFNQYCHDCNPLGYDLTGMITYLDSPFISGYPFDYSPWRPFPGDSGRFFRNLNLPYDVDYASFEASKDASGEDHLAYAANVCYDLESFGGDIVSYCNPAPIIEDIYQWFPIDSADKNLFTYSKFRAWWTGRQGGDQATQIPFLGNSFTSSTEITNNTARMSNFLADFLRGTVFWDRKWVDYEDPDDYQRIIDESGPIRKLYPQEILMSDAYRGQFAACRLFKGQYFGSTPCNLLISTDPIHDYPIMWDIPAIAESYFTDLPDRRDIGIDQGEVRPLRISEFFCGNPDWYRGQANNDFIQWGIPIELCAEGTGENEWPLHQSADLFGEGGPWKNYFPLTTREDVPAFVDVSFEAVWLPEAYGMPYGLELDHEPSIEELYTAVEGFYYPLECNLSDACDDPANLDTCNCDCDTANPVNCSPSEDYVKYEGVYYIPLDHTDDADNIFGVPLPIYEFHFVDVVYIPYVAESKELAQWIQRPILPQGMHGQSGGVGALQLPASISCNAEGAERGGIGDVVAGDWSHSFDFNPYEGDRTMIFFGMPNAETGLDPTEWGCQDPFWEFPSREESRFQNTGKIATKIPYLRTLAEETIGQAGILTALMPTGFVDDAIEAIEEFANGRVNWYELPGYGPAAYWYGNDLQREELEPHWGYCGQGPQSATSCAVPIPHTNPCDDLGGTLYTSTWCSIGTEVTDYACIDGSHHHIQTASCTGSCPEGGTCGCSGGDRCNCNNGTSECSPATYNLTPCNGPEGTRVPCGCYNAACDLFGLGCDTCETCPPTLTESAWLGNVDWRGYGQIVNSDEARFYYPYVGSIDIFREYLTAQVLPYEKAYLSLYNSSAPAGINPQTGTANRGSYLLYSLPFRTAEDEFTDDWLTTALDYLESQGWTENLLQDTTSRNLVINFAIDHGWSPVFLITLWMEESGAGHFVSTGVANEHFGCVPGLEQTLAEGLDCLDRNFSDEFPTNDLFEEFMCRYSEGFDPCCPCLFDTNPQFPENIRFFYNLIAANQV